MRNRIFVYGLPVLALAMLTVALIHTAKSNTPLSALAPPTQPPRAGFAHNIAASAVAEAQTENISVGAALSGVVLQMYYTVDDVGKPVHKGAPLFRVDDRNLQAQLDAAKSRVKSAQAQLDKLKQMPRPEEIPPSEAAVRNAETNAARLRDDFERAQKVSPQGAVTESELIEKKLTYQAAVHQWQQAVAQHKLLLAGAWQADKDIAEAAVNQAKADQRQIDTEIERSIVRSPVEGQILQVNVRLGEYVNSQSGQALFVVGNVGTMHVRADIDEADIPRFRHDGAAVAQLRGDANRKIPLRFERVEPYVVAKKSLTGGNTERVDTRVLQVIYSVAEMEQPIYVGQQLDVYIDSSASGSSEGPVAAK